MITVFSELQSLEKPLDIALGNFRTLEATGRGTEILMLESGFLRSKCKLNDKLYVSELSHNLIIMSALKAVYR